MKLDAYYDFDSFKDVSLFVCLLLTKSGSSHISLTDNLIPLIFGIPMSNRMLITIVIVLNLYVCFFVYY